eukprot:3087076-Amphidinium_carterae.1
MGFLRANRSAILFLSHFKLFGGSGSLLLWGVGAMLGYVESEAAATGDASGSIAASEALSQLPPKPKSSQTIVQEMRTMSAHTTHTLYIRTTHSFGLSSS